MQINYRVRQFWLALTASPASEDIALARKILSPSLFSLFVRLQPDEQAHGLWIVRRLQEQNQIQHELLVAALLHDVGKSRYPLNPWERAVIVLGNVLLPGKAKEWGHSKPNGWKKPFVVGMQHPAWGADMVLKAGGSPRAAELIRRHHEVVKPVSHGMAANGSASLDDYLLFLLQSLDNMR